jgi:hypothetical protein
MALASAIAVGEPATAGDGRPVVMVQVLNPGVVRDLNDALRQAARIFEAAGLVLVPWQKGDGPPPDRVVRVSLVSGHNGDFIGGSGVLGMAVRRANLAYVHIDRVATYALKHRMTSPRALGNAIAHEVGHLLLPAAGHSSTGIMTEILPVVPEVPRFTREQAAEISAALGDPRAIVHATMSLLIQPRHVYR